MQSLKSFSAGFLAAALIVAPALALADAVTTPVAGGDNESCYSMVHTSGTNTMTAGYTETAQVTPATAMMPASYSGGAMTAAVGTETVIPPWIDPATDANFMGSGAMWVSSHTSWPGGSGNTEGGTNTDQWRLFSDSFTLPAGAVVSSAMLYYAGDNAVEVYQNGNAAPIATTNDVYGTPADTGVQNFASAHSVPLTVTAGTTDLAFVVRNWGGAESTTNPTGLLYRTVVNYCIPDPAPTETVQVMIHKYVDGAAATTANSNSASFPMTATWNDEGGIGAGTGTYALDTANSYHTATIEMQPGADYSTNEVFGTTVAANCEADEPFALMGYSTGDTLEAAKAGTPTMTAPSFTDIMSDKYVIVWNHDCNSAGGTIGGTVTGGVSGVGTLAVTSVTPVQTTGTANNSYADGWIYTFNITVPTNEKNLQMKFSDWTNVPLSATLAAGGNMRISSAQADNAGATVPITAANVYSVPALHMTTDMDTGTPGLQVQVKVEVKIPAGSVNGGYNTSYGVQTLP